MVIKQLDGTCIWGSRLTCSMRTQTKIVAAVVAGSCIFLCILYMAYIVRATTVIRKQLYQNYRITNHLIQVQVCR